MAKKRLNVDDTTENMDWIRTPETRKTEAEIHEALRKEIEEE